MAGKFNLLTVMTLNAAGYKSGIDDAKKSTKALQTGTKSAVNSIGGSFSALGGMASNASAPIAGIKNAVMGGVGAFRAMIPAINGVKVALISTGIGAIVVALGVAFAALSSYLTGTTEGADKLEVIMATLKGTFNAIIQRVNLMGSALMKLFEGDFKGMAKDFQAAFKGGLFDEINAQGKVNKEFAHETNRLKREKLNLTSQEVELEAQMAKMRADAKNKDTSITEQKKAQAAWKLKDAELDKRKQKYLYDDWQLQEKINASSDSSYEDLNKALEKKRAYYAELKKDAEDEVAVNRIDFRLNQEKTEAVKSYTEAIGDNIKSLEKQRETMFSQGLNIDEITNNIVVAKNELKKYTEAVEAAEAAEAKKIAAAEAARAPVTPMIPKGYTIQQPLVVPKVPTEMVMYIDYVEELNGKLSETATIAGFVESAIGGLGDAFVTMAEGGEVSFKSLVQNMLGGIRQIISGLLAQAIAAMIAGEAVKGLPGLIMAGIGVTAISAMFAAMPKFENGGIVAGRSYSGDKVTARVNSGEMILNAGQQANLFAMANNGGSFGGEVRFEIEGSKLIGVLNNYGKKINSYR